MGNRAIVGPSKSQILVVKNGSHLRIGFQHLPGIVPGIVVENNDFVMDSGGMAKNAAQAFVQQIAGVPVHDDNGQIHRRSAMGRCVFVSHFDRIQVKSAQFFGLDG
jgi:hypothetical protein